MPTTLNFILQQMFQRTDLADIYSLADPERSKRYIIVAADALESLFIKMQVYPNKKDGVLFLQSIDGIIRAMPPDLRAKQREYCIELAFFFIRIFQTFGALYLSMYDSKLPLADPSENYGPAAAKGVPFFKPDDFLGFSKQAVPKPKSWFGFGGELTQRSTGAAFFIDGDSPYTILNYVLIAPKDARDINTPMRVTQVNIAIPQRSLYDIGANQDRTLKDGLDGVTITYFFERGSYTLELEAILKITAASAIGRQRYTISLTNFRAANDWKGLSTTFKDIPTETLEVPGFGGPPKSIGENYSNTKGSYLNVVLEAMFNKAIIGALGEPPFSVAKYLKKLGYISAENDKNRNIRGTHVYVIRGQETEETVKIAYDNKINMKMDDKDKEKPSNVFITAKLTIKPTATTDTFRASYTATIDFTGAEIKPSELRSYLTVPATTTMKFTTTSDTSAPVSEKNNLSIPEYLERVFTKIVSRQDEQAAFGKGLKVTRAGLVEPYDSAAIPEALKVKKLWAAMAKDPPVKSHCVARAVQLLSLDAIKGDLNKQAYSSICRLSFAYQKDGSLPTPGKPVIQSSGIYALSLLFIEGLVNGAPKIMDSASYADYRKYLKYLFEDYTSITDKDSDKRSDVVPKDISEIKDIPPSGCDNRANTMILVPRPLAQDLRTVTANLISQQQQHVQNAIELIFRIFDQNSIERDRKLKFNPRLIANGMPEVDDISNAARRLLMDYYKGCEETYRGGIVKIFNYEKSTGKPLEYIPLI